MKNIALIPARLGSSRFPGKPLVKILGKPLIQHVWEGTSKSKLLDYVCVCTCDQEIFNFLKSINANVVMTSNTHTRASDRCAEGLISLEKKFDLKFENIVMVQGDEPMVNSNMIEKSLTPIINNECNITNLLGPFHSNDEFESKNSIKVVVDNSYNALYFSRNIIPSKSSYQDLNVGKQVCVISWKRDFLIKFNEMKETTLEIQESVDMLRLLENNFKIKLIPIDQISQPIDTPEDVKVVENLILKSNKN
jgi:3-deoxy-manno-octulosonate cytidylyltransferase (CMP-KDO synthetase)